jgi:hypothetical protein
MTDRHYGLVFIDGDHSFDGVLNDFDIMSGSDVVALHDIHSQVCPGTTNFWHSLRYFRRHEDQFYVFLDQYSDVWGGPFMGIGVMVKK